MAYSYLGADLVPVGVCRSRKEDLFIWTHNKSDGQPEYILRRLVRHSTLLAHLQRFNTVSTSEVNVTILQGANSRPKIDTPITYRQIGDTQRAGPARCAVLVIKRRILTACGIVDLALRDFACSARATMSVGGIKMAHW